MSEFFDGSPPKVEFKTVTVNTLYEIKNIIRELTKQPKNQTLKTLMPSTNSEGRAVNFELRAELEGDYVTLFKQGFDILKNRNTLKQKYGEKADKLVNINSRMWLDDLIERRLGARREGMRIKWDIQEGVYYWDPIDNKLTKCE